MRPSFRAILSILFMLVFAYFMTYFGYWARYSDGGGSTTFLATTFALIASIIIWAIWNLKIGLRDETRNRQKQSQPAIKETSIEKRKRERIDSVLRDLSSEDLMRLRQRLMDGTVNDDVLYDEMMGDDGELVHMNERKY